ncbi:hypothetical protein GLW03_05280 [Halobacillus halophilus]|uniref:hypothetical protein n=1 Tax=Halobacillus halophilus TaxID=1570 RepID=UPI00136B419B|nr:hypothetical protein [Halobacillus halophilus]MYL29223.1 hypothetical protein [Halobacillus halophilus]
MDLYIPAGLLFVLEIALTDVRAAAVKNGHGNAVFTFLGGVFIDWHSEAFMYGIFSLVTCGGIALLFVLRHQMNLSRAEACL